MKRLPEIARMALPLMSDEERREAETLLAEIDGGERTGNAGDEGALGIVGAAFEKDMQPVCDAIVSAMRAGDMEAIKGLRALLPHLLAKVNQSSALVDALSYQLGKSLVDGLTAKPEDVL